MKINQLHINLSKCAICIMYFRPNLHYKERLSCARTTEYDQGLTMAARGSWLAVVSGVQSTDIGGSGPAPSPSPNC